MNSIGYVVNERNFYSGLSQNIPCKHHKIMNDLKSNTGVPMWLIIQKLVENIFDNPLELERFEKELIEFQASRPIWDGKILIYPNNLGEGVKE